MRNTKLKPVVLCAVVIATAGGCGSDPTTSGPTDTVADGDATSGDAESDVPSSADVRTREELCDHVWGRLVACGHTYTFPTFEAECATFDAAEVAVLDDCSRRICANLYLCVRDELHIPEGPR